MPIGSSGRIVVEIEPELKQALHESLRRDGTNLKEWFTGLAESYLNGNDPQVDLPFGDERPLSVKSS